MQHSVDGDRQRRPSADDSSEGKAPGMPRGSSPGVSCATSHIRSRNAGGISSLLKFLHRLCHEVEAFVHHGEDGSFIKFALAVSLPGRRTGKYLDALFDFGNGPDVKFSGGHGFEDVFAQHQVLDVGIGHHHTLRAGEAFDSADVKETLDFFGYSANGLNSALLIDRTNYLDILPQRQSRERRREGVNFSGAGTVAVDSRVGLLEADAGSERKRFVLRKLAAQVTGDDVYAFVVEAPAKIGFTLDIDQSRFAESRGRSDPHGLTKGIAAGVQDAQPVDLAYACAVHIHEPGSVLNHFAEARLDEVVALHFPGQAPTHIRRPDHASPASCALIMR